MRVRSLVRAFCEGGCPGPWCEPVRRQVQASADLAAKIPEALEWRDDAFAGPYSDGARFRSGLSESGSGCLEQYLETAGCREWAREEGVQPGLGP